MSAVLTEVLVDRWVKHVLEQGKKPYIWNGKGPDVFDCSGLFTFCAFLATSGKVDRRRSWNTDTIWRECEPTEVPELGTLCLYRANDSDPNDMDHVEMFLGREMCFGASGGGRDTLTPKPSACVQTKLSYMHHPRFAGFRKPHKLLTP